MICGRERREQTVLSALAGVFQCHSRVPCPTGGANDRRDEKGWRADERLHGNR